MPSAQAEASPEGPLQCIDDSQCNSGGVCKNGRCAEPVEAEPQDSRTNYAHFWGGVSLSMDVVFLGSANDVCALNGAALPFNGKGYYCTNPDGTDFPSRNDGGAQNGTLKVGTAGQAGGGPVIGDLRVLASFDYAFKPNWMIGARVGGVLNGYTGSAAVTNGRAFGPPIQIELRGTYVLGKNALTHSGFSPMVFVGAGVREVRRVDGRERGAGGDPGAEPEGGVANGRPGIRRARSRSAVPVLAADRVQRGAEGSARVRGERHLHHRRSRARAPVRFLTSGPRTSACDRSRAERSPASTSS